MSEMWHMMGFRHSRLLTVKANTLVPLCSEESRSRRGPRTGSSWLPEEVGGRPLAPSAVPLGPSRGLPGPCCAAGSRGRLLRLRAGTGYQCNVSSTKGYACFCKYFREIQFYGCLLM